MTEHRTCRHTRVTTGVAPPIDGEPLRLAKRVAPLEGQREGSARRRIRDCEPSRFRRPSATPSGELRSLPASPLSGPGSVSRSPQPLAEGASGPPGPPTPGWRRFSVKTNRPGEPKGLRSRPSTTRGRRPSPLTPTFVTIARREVALGTARPQRPNDPFPSRSPSQQTGADRIRCSTRTSPNFSRASSTLRRGVTPREQKRRTHGWPKG